MSTKKTTQRSKHKVDAVGHGLGELGIGAEFLAEADQNERLNQGVPAASHGKPSLAEESLSPPAQLPAGVADGQLTEPMYATDDLRRCRLVHCSPFVSAFNVT